MNTTQFYGVWTAMVSPMGGDGQLDILSLEKLLKMQFLADIEGVVMHGTTGESPVLDERETMLLVEKALDMRSQMNLKKKVLVGTGSASTVKARQMTQKIDKMEVDGFLVVTPYYNKPTQEGLFGYFSEIAESTQKPIMLYSAPGRCHVEIGRELLSRLLERYSHIVAIKEASNSLERVSTFYHDFGERLTILSGDDPNTLPFMAVGAKGVVSVASNLIPEVIGKIVNLALSGQFVEALVYHNQYYPLIKALLGLEVNPVTIKYALYLRNILKSPAVRSPLVSLSFQNQQVLKELLEILDK